MLVTYIEIITENMFINTFGPALKVPSIHFCVIMFSRLVFRSIIVIMRNEVKKNKTYIVGLTCSYPFTRSSPLFISEILFPINVKKAE